MSHLVALHIKWRGSLIQFERVDPTSTSIASIKAAVEDKTGVVPCDQKLIGLGCKMGNSTADEDNIPLSFVKYVNKGGIIHIQLMGTPQVELIEQQIKEMENLKLENHQVLNDLSLNITPATREWRKLQDFIQKIDIRFMNKPRSGKKLLVLDLDHTLMHFDSKEEGQVGSTSSSTNHNFYRANHNETYCNVMKRPYLEYFLTCVYSHYDICLWSQTHWKWIEIKCNELGISGNRNFKICFVLDKSSMFKIPPSGYVKPLHIIWSKCGHIWNKHNTVHVDDMERNFVLNKQSGVLVTPFYRNGYINAKNDILTHTIGPAAYGTGGLILSSISTTSSNSYADPRNYAMNMYNGSPAARKLGNPCTESFPILPSCATTINKTIPILFTAPNSNPSLCADGCSHQVMEDTSVHDNIPTFGTALGTTLKHPIPSAVPVNSARVLAPNSSMDIELYYLARYELFIFYLVIRLYFFKMTCKFRYLKNISLVEDVSILDHSRWRLYCHHILPDSPNAVADVRRRTEQSSTVDDGSISTAQLTCSCEHVVANASTPIAIGSTFETSGSGSNPGSASASAAGTPSAGSFLPVLSSSPSIKQQIGCGVGNDLSTLLVRSRSNSIQLKDANNSGNITAAKEGNMNSKATTLLSPKFSGAAGYSKEDSDIPTAKPLTNDVGSLNISSMSYNEAIDMISNPDTCSPKKPNPKEMASKKRSVIEKRESES